jgi:hypothetical protein
MDYDVRLIGMEWKVVVGKIDNFWKFLDIVEISTRFGGDLGMSHQMMVESCWKDSARMFGWYRRFFLEDRVFFQVLMGVRFSRRAQFH